MVTPVTRRISDQHELLMGDSSGVVGCEVLLKGKRWFRRARLGPSVTSGFGSKIFDIEVLERILEVDIESNVDPRALFLSYLTLVEQWRVDRKDVVNYSKENIAFEEMRAATHLECCRFSAVVDAVSDSATDRPYSIRSDVEVSALEGIIGRRQVRRGEQT
ncbi:hypothetical protein BDQ17DRAFT_1337593 [Cyathus striatus]|nr:hypothetical protein BDQ17DRAFT_1337593 [Cyathus striatus]